jgi:hypothetical protein
LIQCFGVVVKAGFSKFTYGAMGEAWYSNQLPEFMWKSWPAVVDPVQPAVLYDVVFHI